MLVYKDIIGFPLMNPILLTYKGPICSTQRVIGPLLPIKAVIVPILPIRSIRALL